MPRAARWVGFFSAAALVLVAVFLGAAWWRGNPPRRAVVLIGIDGATWDIVVPLMRDGRLPSVSGLVGRGFSSSLETLSPSLSPVIWTTVATGRPAEEHGITGFADTDPVTGEPIPFTSNQRAYRAFWNVLSENDRSVGIVGWWVTFPAEAVRGAMVSSYSALRGRTWKGSVYKDFPGQMHPPQLAVRFRDTIESSEREIRDLFDREIATGVDAGRLRPAQKLALEDTRDVVLSDLVYSRIACDLLRTGRYDTFAVYFGSVDVASHRFWKYRDPEYARSDGSSVPDDERRHLGGVIDRAYAFVDRLVGEVVASAPPDSTFIVMSDHGFHAEAVPGLDDDSRSGGHESADLPGMLLVSGPRIAARRYSQGDRRDGDPTVFDVFPTLLYLGGLPVPRDVRGRVLLELFEPMERWIHPVARCETHETKYRHRELGPIRTDVDATLRERWQGIGYLGSPSSRPPSGERDGTR